MMPMKVKTLVIDTEDFSIDEIAAAIEERVNDIMTTINGDVEDIQIMPVEARWGTTVDTGFVVVFKCRERVL